MPRVTAFHVGQPAPAPAPASAASAVEADSVLCTVDTQGFATVSLNRPDKFNSFDDQVWEEPEEGAGCSSAPCA